MVSKKKSSEKALTASSFAGIKLTDRIYDPEIQVINAYSAVQQKKTVRYMTCHIGNTDTQYQIATPTGTNKVYYLGCHVGNKEANTLNVIIYDASSGAPPAIAENSQQGGVYFAMFSLQQGAFESFAPFPILCMNGIRLNAGGVVADHAFITVFYLIESL